MILQKLLGVGNQQLIGLFLQWIFYWRNLKKGPLIFAMIRICPLKGPSFSSLDCCYCLESHRKMVLFPRLGAAVAYKRKTKLEIFLEKNLSLINRVSRSRRSDRNCFPNRKPFFILDGKKRFVLLFLGG